MSANKLKAAIVARGETLSNTARAIGVSKSAFYRKMHRQTEFTRGEINSIASYLDLSDEELISIFFTEKVS